LYKIDAEDLILKLEDKDQIELEKFTSFALENFEQMMEKDYSEFKPTIKILESRESITELFEKEDPWIRAVMDKIDKRFLRTMPPAFRQLLDG
jgi:hypothetical protein